eukprot:SAG11_NODE_4157_length_2034_cov_1.830491_3_plen_208_part_00
MPSLFPWPDVILAGLRKLVLTSADHQLAVAAHPQDIASIATTNDDGCPDDENIFAPLRPSTLCISSLKCADLLYMDRGKMNDSLSAAWPYKYEQPRRKKGNIDTWRNSGGKRALLKWTLTGFEAGDVLERRAGKIVQADEGLPDLKYHDYIVKRGGKPIGCHIYHVCPTAPLIPSSMANSQTRTRARTHARKHAHIVMKVNDPNNYC